MCILVISHHRHQRHVAAGLADGISVRPYLLGGVSLGGLLMKHAFVALAAEAEYAAACKGIVNIVVPHMGSTLSTLTKLLGLAKPFNMDRRTPLLRGLEYASEALVELDDRFSQLKGKVPVLSVAEGRTTNVFQDSVVSSTPSCAACLQTRNAHKLGVYIPISQALTRRKLLLGFTSC